MRRWWPEILAAALLAAPAAAAEPRAVELQVEGMTCNLCPVTVRKALQQVPGVVEARVDFEAKRAHARYDPGKARPEAIAKALTDAGFPARVVSR